MAFEWDEAKAISNVAKHGVTFEQAFAAFDDPDALEIPDERYDYGERRTILIGLTPTIILVVVYTKRGEWRRIISARKANKREREDYYRQKAR